jgi:predicted dehydrogenase
MKQSYVGLGVVGCGSIGVRGPLEHFQWHEYDDLCRITAVCDPVPGRAKAVAEKYEVPKYYDSYEKMLLDATVDAVTLCTPIGMHYQQGLMAIEAGKQIHFNKTMTITKSEADDIIKKAREKGIKIVASPGGMMTLPFYQRMRRAVLEGRLGKLSWAYADNDVGGGSYHLQFDRGGSGVVGNISPEWYFQKPAGGPQYDAAVYSINSAVGILGPVKRVAAISGQQYPSHLYNGKEIKNEVDDSVTLILDYGDGFHCVCNSVIANTVCKGRAFVPNIYGTEGQIIDGVLNGSSLIYEGDHQPHIFGRHLDIKENHVVEDILELADWVKNGVPSVGTPEFARHVIEIIEAGNKAAETGMTQTITTSCDTIPLEQLAKIRN